MDFERARMKHEQEMLLLQIEEKKEMKKKVRKESQSDYKLYSWQNVLYVCPFPIFSYPHIHHPTAHLPNNPTNI